MQATTSQFVMMDVNIDKLIKVIKQHRLLYDTTIKEYFDRSKKKRIWEDVGSIVNSSWDMLDESQKSMYVKQIQKKWQSLRDCFRRELAIQKNQTTGGKKKIKYKYFDALEFLTPFTNTELSGQDATSSEADQETIYRDSSEDSEPSSKKSRRSLEDESSFSEGHIETRRYKDDDEAFLMSLLPSLKEYNLEQKYLLRIELMQTILKFKHRYVEHLIVMNVKREVDDDDD